MTTESREETLKKQLRAGLYLVATPIGHADDITRRALFVLAEADQLFCEDTRETGKLLQLLGIARKNLVALHEHNEREGAEKIIAAIKAGQRVAYVSDAGLPLVSDPGARLVAAVLAEGLYVTSLPGANAALTALQLSALPPQPFVFVGFLPPKATARKKELARWKPVPATLVFYEAPHRIKETLEAAQDVLGQRRAALARELTKKHEEVVRGTLAELVAHSAHREPRGEYVLVIGPPEEDTAVPDEKTVDALLKKAATTLPPRAAAAAVAEATGLPTRALYQRLLALKGK